MQKWARAVGWFLLISIVIVSLVPADLRPETHMPHNLEHLVVFLAMGVALSLGYPESLISLVAGLVSFSISIELAQLFVPGRHARLTDLLVDVAAVTMGVVIGISLGRRLPSPQS